MSNGRTPHSHRPSRRAPRRAGGALVLCAALAAIVTPAASADPPWSPPSVVPGTGNGPAVVTSRGHVAALTPSAAAGRPGIAATQLLRLDPADGRVLSSSGLAVAGALAASYATDRIVVAGRSIGPSGTIDGESRVRVGTTAGAAGTPVLRTLPGTKGQNLPALAANHRGDIALATAGGRSRMIFLRRARTTALTRVLTISVSSTARGVTIALSPSGEVLVVWEDRHEVFARHRGAHSWGPVHALGPGVQSDLQAAFDETGRMMVAWKSQRVDEGEASTPAVVSFITAARGRGFGSRSTVEAVGQTGAGRYVASPGVRLQVTQGDQALLAWTGFDGAHFVVRAAPLARGHRGAAQQLSPAGVDAALGDLAAVPDGRALAVWRSDVAGADPVPGRQPHLFGNVRAAGAATFGGPEAIGGETRAVLTQPTAAMDPASGRGLGLFTDFSASRALVSVRPPATP
jgi:hypothetical protein